MKEDVAISAALPRHVIGAIVPGPDGPYVYAQFYRVFGANGLLICSSLNLGGFSDESIDAALASFWRCFDFLRSFNVQEIHLAGVPMSAGWGRPKMLELLGAARRRSDTPVSSDFEDVIAAAQHLGLSRVAIASKWEPALLAKCAAYVEHAGLDVVATAGHGQSLQELHTLTMEQGFDVALDIASRAFRDAPNAEGLFLLGGHWPVMQAVVELEARFGKPVITNPMAIYWSALRRSALRCASPGMGMLMESLP